MNRITTFTLVLLLFIVYFSRLSSQEVNHTKPHISLKSKFFLNTDSISTFKHAPISMTEEQLWDMLNKQPAFSAYQDNIMVTGVATNKPISRSSADAFFQVSIRQRLTKTILPFKTFLYVIYTQRSFWQIYEQSSPFKDSNYNPGLGLGKYIVRDGKLKGSMSLSLEHESNGRDSIDSRSWNYLNISAKYLYNKHLSMKGQVYIPYVDGGNNKDLLRYRGYGVLSVNFIDKNNLWWVSMHVMPRKLDLSSNVRMSVSYKLSSKSNQYITLDYYTGYGESLLDYSKYSSKIRIGLVIKPDFLNVY